MKVNTFSKIRKGRRAVSGILAAIILFAMLFTTGTGYFLWLTTNTGQVNVAQANELSLLQNKASEYLQVQSCLLTSPLPTWCTGASTTGNIGLSVTNAGGIASTLVALGVLDTTTNTVSKAPTTTGVAPALAYVLNPGMSVVVDSGFAPGSDKYTVSLVTKFGSQFAAPYPSPPGTPVITLSPNSGPISSTVTVTGSNYAAAKVVTITWDGAVQVTVPLVITTTSIGSFSATFVVPAAATLGSHTVTATDANGNTASAIFTVVAGGSVTCPAGSFCNSFNSLTSQGLGFISIDFNHVVVYNEGASCNVEATAATACPAPFHTPFAASQYSGYQVSADGVSFYVFVLRLTNADPQQRSIHLVAPVVSGSGGTSQQGGSVFTAIGTPTNGGGTTAVFPFGLVKVTNYSSSPPAGCNTVFPCFQQLSSGSTIDLPPLVCYALDGVTTVPCLVGGSPNPAAVTYKSFPQWVYFAAIFKPSSGPGNTPACQVSVKVPANAGYCIFANFLYTAGTIGASNFGQNLPYTSTTWTP